MKYYYLDKEGKEQFIEQHPLNNQVVFYIDKEGNLIRQSFDRVEILGLGILSMGEVYKDGKLIKSPEIDTDGYSITEILGEFVKETETNKEWLNSLDDIQRQVEINIKLAQIQFNTSMGHPFISSRVENKVRELFNKWLDEEKEIDDIIRIDNISNIVFNRK